MTTNAPPFSGITTGRLRLRHFSQDDLTSLLAYRNDPDVARYQSWNAMTEESGRGFITEMHASRPGIPGRWFQFAIERAESGEHIGDCALHTLGADARLGEIGYTLAGPWQGHGYAQEAVGAMIGYAFGVLNMHRIMASVDTENTRSIVLLERLHFRREGHFQQCAWFNEHWCDEYLYAMLRDEWQARGK